MKEAKEKAEELVEKYLSFGFRLLENYLPVPKQAAIQCAIIAVEEILENVDRVIINNYYREVLTHLNEMKG